jgi:hypothetical protein
MQEQSCRRTLVRNGILASLPPSCLAAIVPFLRQVALKERLSLQEPKKPIEQVYFVESGIVSLRTTGPEGFVEVAAVGYQGAVDVSCLLGRHVPAHQSIVLVPGNAIAIRADDFLRVVCEHPEFQRRLLQYVQGLVIHEAQTALCGIRHELENRLAAWLCLTSDALDGSVLPITHDYFAAAEAHRCNANTNSL